MELTPPRSIPSSPIKNVSNERNKLKEDLINVNIDIDNYEKDVERVTKKIKDLEKYIDTTKNELEEYTNKTKNDLKEHINKTKKGLKEHIDKTKKDLEEYKYYKEFYSDMLFYRKEEKKRVINLLKEINTEIAKKDKISPLNKKKRSLSVGGTKKKTRRNRRKTIHRR